MKKLSIKKVETKKNYFVSIEEINNNNGNINFEKNLNMGDKLNFINNNTPNSNDINNDNNLNINNNVNNNNLNNNNLNNNLNNNINNINNNLNNNNLNNNLNNINKINNNLNTNNLNNNNLNNNNLNNINKNMNNNTIIPNNNNSLIFDKNINEIRNNIVNIDEDGFLSYTNSVIKLDFYFIFFDTEFQNENIFQISAYENQSKSFFNGYIYFNINKLNSHIKKLFSREYLKINNSNLTLRKFFNFFNLFNVKKKKKLKN
jgi:hypothetical protein